MKKHKLVLALTALAFLGVLRTANAAPCSAVDGSLINGNFTFTHTALSVKKQLLKMTVFQTTPATSSKRMLGDGAPFVLHGLYNVTNLQFASDATEDQIRLLQQTAQVATVTQPNSPDLCFLVWFSTDNQLLDVNVILGQNGSGDMSLGSSSKLDPNLYMTLIRQPAMRR